MYKNLKDMDLYETPNRPLMLIFWYQKMIFWYEKLISDIRKSISDIRKSISDIRKSARISDIRKSFMYILISETRFSYIRNYFFFQKIISDIRNSDFLYQKIISDIRILISENHFLISIWRSIDLTWIRFNSLRPGEKHMYQSTTTITIERDK